MADANALETVRIKLIGRINLLEEQLKQVRQKLHMIDGALGVLFEEGEDKSLNKVVDTRKDKYKDLKLTQAILDCVNTYGQTRELSPAEVRKNLKDNGLKTTSKHFYTTVFVALKRLSDKGIIDRVEGKGFRKKQNIMSNEPQTNQGTL